MINDIKQIDKDLDRTSFLIELEEKKRLKVKNSLRNILITFSAFNQSSSDDMFNKKILDLGYTQGLVKLIFFQYNKTFLDSLKNLYYFYLN